MKWIKVWFSDDFRWTQCKNNIHEKVIEQRTDLKVVLSADKCNKQIM